MQSDNTLDANYIIRNNILSRIDDWKIKFILNQYAEKVEKRLLDNGSYYISCERNDAPGRKLIVIRIKRTSDPILPKLVLTVEMESGMLIGKKIEIKVNSIFNEKLDKYPKDKRYKFPKL